MQPAQHIFAGGKQPVASRDVPEDRRGCKRHGRRGRRGARQRGRLYWSDGRGWHGQRGRLQLLSLLAQRWPNLGQRTYLVNVQVNVLIDKGIILSHFSNEDIAQPLVLFRVTFGYVCYIGACRLRLSIIPIEIAIVRLQFAEQRWLPYHDIVKRLELVLN